MGRPVHSARNHNPGVNESGLSFSGGGGGGGGVNRRAAGGFLSTPNDTAI